MPEVNINAIAMSDSVIDPMLVLFVARGTQKGLPGRDMWLTEIAYDGPPYPYVHLTQSAHDVVAQLIGLIPLIQLTAPDGSPVWANRAKITYLQPTTEWQRGGGVPGWGAPPRDAQYILFLASASSSSRRPRSRLTISSPSLCHS